MNWHPSIAVPKMSGLAAVIIAELKFRDVRRQIFGADLVKPPTIPRLKIDQKPSIVLV
jgi:hypothetical protein